MDHKEKAIEITEFMLSALGKKDDPVKEMLISYLERQIKEIHDKGLIKGYQPF